MPIHLPPLSRRQFLIRALAAGAGLTVAPSVLAATRRDPNAWALLADTHLAANQAQMARGINMAGHFKSVSQEVLALKKRPAGVFIGGDCSLNSGEPGDYATLAGLLQPMRTGQLPVHLALGNHDHRERFWEGFTELKAAKRPVLDKHSALIESPRANWLVLDSLEKTLSTPGLLGQEQLDWLARVLDANPSKPALVLVHHNPYINGHLGLKDTQALFDVIRPRKQVKAYIYGHTHRWKIEQDQSGIHLINLPPVAYVFREGDPSGWVLATVSRKGMNLELRCVKQTHPEHGKVTELKWRT